MLVHYSPFCVFLSDRTKTWSFLLHVNTFDEVKFCLTDLTINDIRCQHFTDIILIITALYSKFLLFKLVEEMATSAGLQCELDPVLCEALRVHKGEFFFLWTRYLQISHAWLYIRAVLRSGIYSYTASNDVSYYIWLLIIAIVLSNECLTETGRR